MVARSEKKFHHRRDHSIDKVGLSIHCIGLDTAYSLLSRSSSNVDFRFVPSLPEVKAVLEHSSQGDTNNERQLEQTLSRKALSIISDQYNSAFRGVPIYIVVVKDKFEALQDSEKFKSSSTKTNSSANYIFFDREQALEFCEKYSSRMVSPIYTDNLEDFLELWEESILLKSDSNNSKFVINENQPVYFIPSKRSAKVLEEYHNKPKNSLKKSVQLWSRKKLDKLNWFKRNYLGLIFRGDFAL